jgi:hypothetical protein
MKKIVKPPNEQLPLPLPCDDDCKPKHESFRKREIPTDLSKFNIHKIEDLKQRLDKVKMENKQYDFHESIHKVLDLYDEKELHYSENIVYFVMNEIEKYILKPKAGQAKEELCIQCVKKYFNDDDDLVRLIIKLLFKQLHQIKFSERQFRKVVRFFSRIL